MLKLALVLLGIYAALCLLAYVFQDRLVYFPGPPPDRDPGLLGLDFDELRVATADGAEIRGWFVRAPDARGAVLHCHGNAGSVGDRLEAAAALVERGWSVLLFDYRGYGHSRGRPSEEGTYRDAEAAFDWLVRERGLPPAWIAAWGESLGAAVALELALRRPVGALVLESAFTSLADVGARAYPFLPVRWLARLRHDNAAKIERVGVPLLVTHSPADEIVPCDHGRALFERAREPKVWLATEGGHNGGGWLRRAEWRDAATRFLAEAIGAPGEYPAPR